VLLICAALILSLLLSSCGAGNSSESRSIPNSVPVVAVVSTANPLVAQYNISFLQPGLTAWVEFGIDTSYGRQTSVVPSSGGQTFSILVAGMTAQTTYHMRGHLNWSGGSWVDQDRTFATGTISTVLPTPQVSISSPVGGPQAIAPAQGIELLSLASASGAPALHAVAVDLQGNIIWYCPYGAQPVKPMQNGHFILLEATDLLEVDLACNVVRDVSLFEVKQSLQASQHSYNLINFSHDVLTLPNGHWVTIIQVSQDFTDLPGYPGTTSVLGDIVVDINPNSRVVWFWSAFDHLDITRHPYFGLPDWTHSNALVHTRDGNLLLSMRAQSWVLKIDYADGTGSGNVIWKLGQDGDFTLSGGDPSQWFYGQHYPKILSGSNSQTTVAVYDDGNYRIDPSTGLFCGSSGAPACYSRATIFQIDESTNLATLSWQDLPGYFSFWGGSIDLLSNGDIEFDSSEPFDDNTSQITEVTQTASPQIVWQMNITGTNAYRGLRVPSLYPGVAWSK